MDEYASDIVMCRMCMCEDDAVFYNIYESDISIGESVVSKIWNCLNLKVFLGDGHPIYICHQCLYKLDRFNSFREMCHASFIHLRKYQYSSYVQNTIQIEDMKMETVVREMSPVPFGSGCAVEFSEGTLDEDVAERSDPLSRSLFSHNSDVSETGLEESQTTQCASDSVISLRDSRDHFQSVFTPDRSSLLLNQPPCTSSNHSASSQILNILKVSSDMILFPANDVLNNESSSISAILPMDNTCKSYSNTSSAEYSRDNRSVPPLVLQAGGSSQTGTVTRENEGYKPRTLGKLHTRENHVPPRLISTLSQESENSSGHNNVNSLDSVTATKRSLELEKDFKQWTMDPEENRNGRKCKLRTAVSNTKCQKYSNKISQRHHQAVNMSSVPKTRKRSSNHARTNFKPESGKERELATRTVSVENDDDPPECCACDAAISRNYYFRQHVRKHLHSLQDTRNKKHILEKCPKTFNRIR